MCKKIGMSNAGFYQSLNNQTINLNTFEKICKELNLNPNDYFELGFDLPANTDIIKRLESVENTIRSVKEELKNFREKSNDSTEQ